MSRICFREKPPLVFTLCTPRVNTFARAERGEADRRTKEPTGRVSVALELPCHVLSILCVACEIFFSFIVGVNTT